MKYLLLLLNLLPLISHEQQCTIREIKRKPKEEFYKTKDSTIVFPIIITSSQSISKLINTRIKNELVDSSENKKTIQTALDFLIADGVTDISYNVAFNKNNILSLNINTFGCGAHCTSETLYFNFDLRTGNPIVINEVVRKERLDSFQNMVLKEKITALSNYKKGLSKQLVKSEIDSSDYDFVMEEIDSNCINSINLEHFSLSNSYIEISDPCDFPTAYRAMEPDYELKFDYRLIKEFLNPKLFRSLIK